MAGNRTKKWMIMFVAIGGILFFLPLFLHIAVDEAAAGPTAVIDQTTYAFSSAIAGAEVTHPFTIGNRGDAPLNIVGVQTG